jgi:hypothetical protein
MSKNCVVMQVWGIDGKPIDLRFQKYNFQTVISSRFCNKGPWNSIEHKIRKRIILTFTFFRLDSWKNLLFTSTENSSDVRVRHWQKDYWSWIPKIQFSDWSKFKSLLQEPWNAIEDKVRNGLILTFTSFSITELEKLAFYVHKLSSYARMRHRQKAYWP